MDGGARRPHAPSRAPAVSRACAHGRARPKASRSTTIPRAPSAIFPSISTRKFAARSPRPRRWRPRASTARSISGAAAPSRSRARSRARGGWGCATSTAAIPATTPTIPRSAISRRYRASPAPSGRSTPANANDYIYITDGNGRDHGFLHLEATVNATEAPRRLKPINVYYHMFAGERAAQLAGVRHHLDAARQALLTPIAASHYAAIADGFFSTRDDGLGRIELADPQSRRAADRAVRRCRRSRRRFHAQRRRAGPAQEGKLALRGARRGPRRGDRRARPGYQRQRETRRRRI